MTRLQVKTLVLSVAARWNRNSVWRVTYELVDGTVSCQWFKHEEVAKAWAAFISSAVVEMVPHTLAVSTPGFTEAQVIAVHDVQSVHSRP